MKSSHADAIRSWLVGLPPRCFWSWLWNWSEDSGVPLGAWAPHVFGRAIGVGAVRVEDGDEEG